MLSGKGGVRWLCPFCENEDIVQDKGVHPTHYSCPACNGYFSHNARIILGKRSKVIPVRDFIRRRLDEGKNVGHRTRSVWNKSPTFDLYFRAGVFSYERDKYELYAVVSNVTSRDPGIGNYGRLLAFIEAEARARGYAFLTIENPQEDHAGIYERRGFAANRNCGYLTEYRKSLKDEK